MLPLTYNIAALLLYLCAGGYLLHLLIKSQTLQQPWLLSLTACAIAFHGLALCQLMLREQGVDLAINHVFSLVMLSINTIVLLSALRKPLHSLLIFLLPISALSIALSTIKLSDVSLISGLEPGVVAHILLSIVAYCLITTATLQAVLLYWQNRHLKKRQLTVFVQHLPPLQTMESLMFELLWVGVSLLTVGIVLGFLYFEDMFAQHLLHKTVLSIVAWLVFATLLWGRVVWGWRGNTAIRWLLGGFCLLMMAYFGSKLVLEVILL